MMNTGQAAKQQKDSFQGQARLIALSVAFYTLKMIPSGNAFQSDRTSMSLVSEQNNGKSVAW
eukprot:1639256-Amphidinium_carterae.1